MKDIWNYKRFLKHHIKGKISLFSRYERVVDRRTFKDRRDLWAIEKEKPQVDIVKPKAKIRNLELGINDDKKRKPRKRTEEAAPAVLNEEEPIKNEEGEVEES